MIKLMQVSDSDKSTRKRIWMERSTSFFETTPDVKVRNIRVEDGALLGRLMDRSYRGTIDFEGETLVQFVTESVATLDGKYGKFLDFASYLVEGNGEAMAASVITLWHDLPLLAFSMTSPEFQRKGIAGKLIEQSLASLHEHGFKTLRLVVTSGNAPAEALYRRLGFSEIKAAR